MTIRPVAVAAVLLVLLAPAAALAAMAQRTFVGSNGSDAHPCSLSQPCRSFATAIANTSSGGEVIVLDSAGYGPVVIHQSVSIIAPQGIYAGVTVASGTGIHVENPGIVVALRGLSIDGQGGSRGIVFQQGAFLSVEACEITKFLVDGIVLGAPGGRVSIRNVRIRHSTYNGFTIFGQPGGGIQVSIVDSEIANNLFGVQAIADGLAQVTIAHSTLTNNATALFVAGNAGGNASIFIDGDTITYSDTVFMFVGTSAIYTASNNTVGYYGTVVSGGLLTPCCNT